MVRWMNGWINWLIRRNNGFMNVWMVDLSWSQIEMPALFSETTVPLPLSHQSQSAPYRARSTTYRNTGNRSSMDHRKSCFSRDCTSCVISSKVSWITCSLSDGVNVVLQTHREQEVWLICAHVRITITVELTFTWSAVAFLLPRQSRRL